MVRSQSMSAGRLGLLVRLARFSAPVTAEPGLLGQPPLQVSGHRRDHRAS